jgi:hypothetical protein
MKKQGGEVKQERERGAHKHKWLFDVRFRLFYFTSGLLFIIQSLLNSNLRRGIFDSIQLYHSKSSHISGSRPDQRRCLDSWIVVSIHS